MKTFLKNNKKWVLTLSLVILMVIAGVGTVSAAEFPKGETIPESQTIDDDVFISGANVVVDGTVNGVLLAAGETVTLNGTVNGDAFLVGETVIISENAVIDGNLFTGAAEIVLEGTVEGSVFGGSSAMEVGSAAAIANNMYYGGFSLLTDEGSSIGRDLYSGAYQMKLSGSVARDLSVGLAALELNGSVGRNAYIEIGEADESQQSTEWMDYNPWISKYVDFTLQPGLVVADSAVIEGKTTYVSSVNDSSRLDDASLGAVVYQTPVPYSEVERDMRDYSGRVRPFNETRFRRGLIWNRAFNVVQSLIKFFALGALALWLVKKQFGDVVKAGYAEPLKAMGWGFIVIAIAVLSMFIIPLVFVLAGIVVSVLSLGGLMYVWFGLLGSALLLATALFFFAVFTLSKVIASYMLGKWLMKVLFKQTEEKVWLDLLVGVFLYVVIRAIPVVGWLAALAATLIGTGAMWLAFSNRPKKKTKK